MRLFDLSALPGNQPTSCNCFSCTFHAEYHKRKSTVLCLSEDDSTVLETYVLIQIVTIINIYVLFFLKFEI